MERARPYLIVFARRPLWHGSAGRIAAAAQEAGFSVEGRAGRYRFGNRIRLSRRLNGEPFRCLFYSETLCPTPICFPRQQQGTNDIRATDKGATNRAASLHRLKARLAEDEELKPRIRRYSTTWDPELERVTNLEAFGDQVFADLLHELQVPDANRATESTPLEEDRAALRAFVELRNSSFVGREELTRDTLNLAYSLPEGGAMRCMRRRRAWRQSALFARIHSTIGGRCVAYSPGPRRRSGPQSTCMKCWPDECRILPRFSTCPLWLPIPLAPG